MKRSLHSRLVVAASIALLSFLGVAGIALDKAFQHRSEVAVEGRLRGQVFSLLVAADVNDDGRLYMAEEPPDPRFAQIDSGLYGQITDGSGTTVWQSNSAIDKRFPKASVPLPGQVSFTSDRLESGEAAFFYRFGVAWEKPGNRISRFMFAVVEDTSEYAKQVGAFRETLWVWLGGAAIVLLMVQAIVLRWSLRPLIQVATEIDEVEKGKRDVLENDHPREISRLTESINTMLRSERERQRRYRNDMDNLAHSLKTPLVVLRGWLDAQPDREAAREPEKQVERISQSVEYHLRRSASGAATFSKALRVEPVVSELTSALTKVYAYKSVKLAKEVPSGLEFFGDRGDLMEVLGNILDNAFKYCMQSVEIFATPIADSLRPGLRIVIRDDGDGFPVEMGNRVLERGVRADSRTEGHGIGLASARDIVDVYGGTLEIGKHPMQGAVVTIVFPAG